MPIGTNGSERVKYNNFSKSKTSEGLPRLEALIRLIHEIIIWQIQVSGLVAGALFYKKGNFEPCYAHILNFKYCLSVSQCWS